MRSTTVGSQVSLSSSHKWLAQWKSQGLAISAHKGLPQTLFAPSQSPHWTGQDSPRAALQSQALFTWFCLPSTPFMLLYLHYGLELFLLLLSFIVSRHDSQLIFCFSNCSASAPHLASVTVWEIKCDLGTESFTTQLTRRTLSQVVYGAQVISGTRWWPNC